TTPVALKASLSDATAAFFPARSTASSLRLAVPLRHGKRRVAHAVRLFLTNQGRTTLHCPARTRLNAPASFEARTVYGLARNETVRIRSHTSVQEIKPENSGTCSLGQDYDRRRKPPVFPDRVTGPDLFKLHLLPANEPVVVKTSLS